MMVFGSFSHYLIIVFVPMLILCLPTRISSILAMFIAFGSGIAIDFLCCNPLGMSAIALVPIALCRRFFVSLVFGSELLSEGENISYARYGVAKFVVVSILVLTLFLGIYIFVDSASLRDFVTNLKTFIFSLLASIPFCLGVAKVYCSDNRSRWK